MPVRQLQAQHEFDDIELRQHLAALIDQEKIALVFGNIHPNPHVRALPDEPMQLRKLESRAISLIWEIQVHAYLVLNRSRG